MAQHTKFCRFMQLEPRDGNLSAFSLFADKPLKFGVGDDFEWFDYRGCLFFDEFNRISEAL